jgi:hypothetical protein
VYKRVQGSKGAIAGREPRFPAIGGCPTERNDATGCIFPLSIAPTNISSHLLVRHHKCSEDFLSAVYMQKCLNVDCLHIALFVTFFLDKKSNPKSMNALMFVQWYS